MSGELATHVLLLLLLLCCDGSSGERGWMVDGVMRCCEGALLALPCPGW